MGSFNFEDGEVVMTVPEFPNAGGSPIGGEVCIPNINTSERRKRLTFGVIVFVISLVILAALMALGVSRWWRLALFPLFMSASSGFFQWRDKT
jgi:hypothetical protein